MKRGRLPLRAYWLVARMATRAGAASKPRCATRAAVWRSLGLRAADCDLVHPEMRLTDADRHPLAGLAAIADAGVEFGVVADHRDAAHGVRSVADQHGALDRRRHLAVLDEVGF